MTLAQLDAIKTQLETMIQDLGVGFSRPVTREQLETLITQVAQHRRDYEHAAATALDNGRKLEAVEERSNEDRAILASVREALDDVKWGGLPGSPTMADAIRALLFNRNALAVMVTQAFFVQGANELNDGITPESLRAAIDGIWSRAETVAATNARVAEAERSKAEGKRGNMLFVVGDHVYKMGGDYRFTGIVMAAFYKRGHEGDRQRERYAVENDEGLVHIFSGSQLHRGQPKG